MKKLLMTIVLVVCAAAGYAQGRQSGRTLGSRPTRPTASAVKRPQVRATKGNETVDGVTWHYTVSLNRVMITEVGGNHSGDLTIPSSLGGRSVTDVANWTFSRYSGVTSVTIPSSVTNIGWLAFSGCASLSNIVVRGDSKSYSSKDGVLYDKEVTQLIRCPRGKKGVVAIPSSVTHIREDAFDDCVSLISVIIPTSVTSIGHDTYFGVGRKGSGDGLKGNRAFTGCSGLMSFVVSPENAKLSSVNGLLCTKDGKAIIAGVNGNITIPPSVTSIGNRAFEGYGGLKSVTIPSGVTSIGARAFFDCTKLTSITIPSSVTNVGAGAFCGCRGLADSDGFVIVDGVLFDYFKEIRLYENVAIPLGVTSIAKSVFERKGKLTSVTIPSGVTNIESRAFSGCSGLESVTIPPSVTSIGGCAFSGCSGLKSVTIPPNVVDIGTAAFSCCSGLTSVKISSGGTRIGARAFWGCTNLTSVTIPENVMDIGCQAFERCSRLTDSNGFIVVKGILCGYYGESSTVRIPSGVTRIGAMAFSDCHGLAGIKTFSRLGSRFHCGKITSLQIPSSVTSIGDNAFYDCDGLKLVTMPSGLTNAVKSAFGRTGTLLPSTNGITTVVFDRQGAVKKTGARGGLLGGSLRARRLQRQQEAEAAAAKKHEKQESKDAGLQRKVEMEKK